tara:strand:- start:1163 stop:1423 length:261 start_codon:yes stop_codon:yes gene_type:complete
MSDTTGIVLTDRDIADPNGGVNADKPTTIRYAGTTFFMALIPVCFSANIPAPFNNPCFFNVGTSFFPVVDGDDLRVFLFRGAIFQP